MKKIIKRKLHISTYSRDFIDYINHEFYSHDKHNAFFEFTMEQLPTDNVVALFYFQKTKRYAEIHGVVEGNKVTIEFDTSLITTNETVCGYIYFEKVEQSADVCRFCFNVKVSEIDKLKNVPIVEKDTRRLIPVSEIVTKTELQELFKTIERNGGTYNATEIRKSISSIDERVKTLEAKPDNSTGHVDDDVINRLNALEKNASSYLTEHQPLTSIEDTIKEIVKRFNNLSNIYLTSHQSLEHLATNDALNKIEQRVQQLEQTRGNQPTVDNHDFVTRDELEELRNNQPTVDTSKLATNDKVTEVENRVLALENKTDNFISGVSVNKEGNNVTLTYTYVDGQSKNVSFTDSDTINIAYDDSALKSQLNDLKNRPQIDITKLVSKEELPNLIQHQPLTDYAKKSEVPTVESVNKLLETQGEQATKISTLESKSAYEIHGTGMPNGRVTAPIGTTYVDTAVTNGALKWIKESGDGDRGWKILIGDTGWRNLNISSKLGGSTLHVRRVNNVVTYKFGGLQWGWFGIVRRGGAGYSAQVTDLERNCYILWHDGVPLGFRTPNSLIGAIYNDRGVPYGTWYIGSPADANHLRFQFLNPVPTDSDIGDIRVSTISYYTDDEWPSTLP